MHCGCRREHRVQQSSEQDQAPRQFQIARWIARRTNLQAQHPSYLPRFRLEGRGSVDPSGYWQNISGIRVVCRVMYINRKKPTCPSWATCGTQKSVIRFCSFCCLWSGMGGRPRTLLRTVFERVRGWGGEQLAMEHEISCRWSVLQSPVVNTDDCEPTRSLGR
ncbi:hypothetical protein SCLCIDRAFT_261398 [Scleroderma citrinum Foug A]|uniref:Uncharacterized protein n=1 Tax=Scleroderma citrinum Foug A TaxID=1036808 RepID=A0A0C3APM9_9AGAM|nr:hypothetical protein SCLCIDRAFT_261398 [Scleroderma citrinum Foug A]